MPRPKKWEGNSPEIAQESYKPTSVNMIVAEIKKLPRGEIRDIAVKLVDYLKETKESNPEIENAEWSKRYASASNPVPVVQESVGGDGTDATAGE